MASPVPLRARQLSEVEREGVAIVEALIVDLDSTGQTDVEICDQTRTDRGHLSRIRAKTAHPSATLIAFAVDHSRHRPPAYLAAVCAVAGYEAAPRPPPDVAVVFEAYRNELSAAGLDVHFRERVERRLGVVLATVKGIGT